MAYYENAYTVEIHTLGGTTVTFADSADTPGAGTSAYTALMGHQDICGLGAVEGGDPANFFIPFHAVDAAIYSLSRTEGEAPVDDTCQ